MAESQNRRKAESGAAIGAGGTAAGVGLIGGGIPGFKANSSTIENMKRTNKTTGARNSWPKRAGATASSLRGGIFGWRTDAHKGFLRTQQNDEKHFAGKPANRADMYHRGVGSGKIGPEEKIIRHMKLGRRASGVALVGGTAAIAAGVHHAKGPKKPEVSKAERPQHRSDTANAALATGGAAAAGTSYGGARLLEREGRKWNAKAKVSYAESAKVIPNLKAGKELHHPKLTANTRVGSVWPAQSNDKITNEHKRVLAGKSKVQAAEAGAHRGRALQEGYFGNVYGKTAKMVRKVPKPALAVAGVGASGLLASRATAKAKEIHQEHQQMKKSYNPRVSAFGVEH